jgi:cell division protein FtsN
MAAKRGRKQARRNGGSAGTPGWIWLLVGLLIGGVVWFGVYLKMPRAGDNGLPRPNASAQPPKASNTGIAPEGSAPTSPAAAVPKKTQFDFYTLLPEKEVVIPDEELSARVKAEAAALAASKAQATPESPAGSTPDTGAVPTAGAGNSASTPTANASPAAQADTVVAAAASGRYLLQAGAFRNSAQADDLKARIALLGLVGRVEIVQTPNGPMHRVRLGPYTTASELEQAKQTLGNGGLPAVAIRVK